MHFALDSGLIATMQGEQPRIYNTDKLTFYIFDNKVIIMTAHQAFYLAPRKSYYRRRVNMISRMIEINEIRDLNELAQWSGAGVEWISTEKKHYLAPEVALV